MEKKGRLKNLPFPFYLSYIRQKSLYINALWVFQGVLYKTCGRQTPLKNDLCVICVSCVCLIHPNSDDFGQLQKKKNPTTMRFVGFLIVELFISLIIPNRIKSRFRSHLCLISVLFLIFSHIITVQFYFILFTNL